MTIDALVCSEPGKLEIVKRPALQPNSYNVLVRPRRVGICGTDYHIFEGKHPFLDYPRVMGHELAVEVVAAPETSGFSLGDVCVVNPYLSCGSCPACKAGKPNCCVNISVLGVHQDGGMAGLLSIPPGNLIHAQGMNLDECAAVEFLAIGAHAVRRGGVTENDKVLVVGAGPIGLGAVLFAKVTGASVYVFDRDPERVALAKTITGVSAIDVENDFLEEIASFTNSTGFDVVFDATGNSRAMEASFNYVGHGGRYVLVGVVKGPLTFMDPEFHSREMTLFGSCNATTEDFERVMAAIRGGHVQVSRLITHRTTLEGAVASIPIWASDKTGLIKALIEIGK
jgi:2-desacetyl-2-hydroxyethyl bacteriochlorophyllide A dehydrogenase